jgi:hypothetical protein
MSAFVESFEEIRPYHDEEVQGVLQRLINKPSFSLLMRYLFPDRATHETLEDLRHIQSTQAFQAQYIRRAIRRIISDSTEGLSISGLDQLDKLTPYFFISNHRDIILDSAFLNVLLFEHGYDTTQIAIGDNLMVSQLVTDLMKLNKSFVVHRSLGRHEFLAYSERLSRYLRHVQADRQESVWMAQRNGRAKDGNDRTQAALLKMLDISGKKLSEPESFRPFRILPMAISYEYEPCDNLKAEELVHQALGLPYTKDDKLGMIRGIRDPKGRVHIGLGSPLDAELDTIEASNRNDWMRQLAGLIDRQIWAQFHLWPTHYLAADLLADSNRFAGHYSPAQLSQFMQHMEKRLLEVKGDRRRLQQQFLEIYAQPVWNKLGEEKVEEKEK